MKLRYLVLFVVVSVLALAGCSLRTGNVPVDSPLKPWEPPDTEELAEDDFDEDGDLDEAEAAEPAAAGDGAGSAGTAAPEGPAAGPKAQSGSTATKR
jgi:hypothetical protein